MIPGRRPARKRRFDAAPGGAYGSAGMAQPPTGAVAAAATVQRALHAEAWPKQAPLRVRMALHTGEADLREGDYYGPAVNRCARLRAVAHAGQTLLSQATAALVREALPEGTSLRDVG